MYLSPALLNTLPAVINVMVGVGRPHHAERWSLERTPPTRDRLP